MIDEEEYLEEKYIAFVDVLGFSEMVYNFKFNKNYDPNFNYTDMDTFHVVNEYYNKVLIELMFENESALEITTISDCIIVSSKYIIPLIKFLFYLQSNMIFNDAANVRILMRGFLTKGNFVHNQKRNLIVGEAYQRAIEGEKVTKYPRIEIDNTIINDIPENFKILIWENISDSKYFINYLIREKFVKIFCRKPLDKFIDEKINEYNQNQQIQEKYIWLKEYYNKIKTFKPTNDDVYKFNNIFQFPERDI